VEKNLLRSATLKLKKKQMDQWHSKQGFACHWAKVDLVLTQLAKKSEKGVSAQKQGATHGARARKKH
jgi:hypothetical protein